MRGFAAMNRSSKRRALWLSALLALAAVNLATAGQPGEETGSRGETIDEEEAIRIDAQSYAEGFGVGIDEARRRIAIISEVDAAAQVLGSALPDRYAGGWYEHTPAFRAVLRFAGDSPLGPLVAALVPQVEGLSAEVGAAHPLTALIAAQERVSPAVSARYPDMGLEVSVRDGAVRLTGPYKVSAKELVDFAAIAGVPVIAREEPSARPEHTYGGKNITIPPKGCTTAFTVQDAVSLLKGVMTAGHCVDPGVTNGTYYQTDSLSYAVTLGGKRWDANQDFSWWQNSSHAYYAQFWDGANLRTQTSVKARNSMEGNPVCHFGRTTGYSCGLTISVSYNPGSTYCNGGACAAVWVKVGDAGGYNIKCWAGDSGGPYFWINAAWGVHSGGAHTSQPPQPEPEPDDCVFSVMFSAEGLTWDGVNTRIYLP